MAIDPELQRLIDGVTNKRPRRVLDHILEHGYVTTAELTSVYGYGHPPRAAQDVRDHGIPLVTFSVKGPDGRRIGAYRLGDPAHATGGRRGRRAFPKDFKKQLVILQGERCALCGWHFPARALQIDHRVPYEVAGDAASLEDLGAYMLVCGSCNSSKAWSCEHCPNGITDKDAAVCQTCMWGSPEGYEHIATEQRRSLTIAWQDSAVQDFAKLQAAAAAAGQQPADYARDLLRRSL